MRSKRLIQRDKDFIIQYKEKLSLKEIAFLTGVDKSVIQQYINKITPKPEPPEKVIIRPKEKVFVRPPAIYSNKNFSNEH